MDLQEQYISFLKKETLQNIALIEAIRRGNAHILAEQPNGVLLQEKRSGVYMLSVDSLQTGQELLKILTGQPVRELMLNREDLIPQAQEYLNLLLDFSFYHAAYLKTSPPLPAHRLTIHPLDEAAAEQVAAVYAYLNQAEALAEIRSGHLFGGYWNGVLIGFVGEHPEGSIGLLEVFPEYRRRGFGLELENYMIAQHVAQGKVPFAQVFTENKNSLSLQRKLGMTLAEKPCFWLSAHGMYSHTV